MNKPYSGGIVFAIEGLFGVGKSTLAQNLVNVSSEEAMLIPERFNSEFLKLFYADPQKYAFAFQWGMLNMRLFQKKSAAFYKMQVPPKLVIWDRSALGDYIFALANKVTGSISQEEFDVYETEFNDNVHLESIAKSSAIEDIDCFIYLYDLPILVKDRVENVRKRKEEKDIPHDYYNIVDLVHFNLMLQIASEGTKNVVFFTPAQFGNGTDEYAHFYRRILDESNQMKKYKANVWFHYTTCDYLNVTGESSRIMDQHEAEALGRRILKDGFDIALVLPDILSLRIPDLRTLFKDEFELYEYPEWFRALVAYHLSRRWSSGRDVEVHLFRPKSSKIATPEQIAHFIDNSNKYYDSTCDL